MTWEVLSPSYSPPSTRILVLTGLFLFSISTSGKIYHWGDLFSWQDTVKEKIRPSAQEIKIRKFSEKLKKREPIDIACGCNHLVVAVKIQKIERKVTKKKEEEKK